MRYVVVRDVGFVVRVVGVFDVFPMLLFVVLVSVLLCVWCCVVALCCCVWCVCVVC